MTTKYTIVLLRHGESEYNKVNRFCGWYDADLSPLGVEEAKAAGQVVDALNRHIGNINFPQDQAALAETKRKFFRYANIPNCIGAVDGTLIEILAPRQNEAVYVCRKGYHSINVQAVVDADMRFTDVVAKWPGSTHDSTIFNNSGIQRWLEHSNNGWLVGDSGYALRPYLLTPKMLKEKNYTFDIAFTSLLKRAIKTLYYAQEELDLHWIPVVRHWRLNERHYGALQGLNKSETAAKHGEAQVKIWRRSYDTPPPALESTDERSATNEAKYNQFDKEVVPMCECLKDTVARVLPYWHDVIVPAIKSGQKIIISAHGNSLRALIKYLDNIPDADISELNVPTGIPLIYELDENLKPVKHFYLASEEQVKAAMERVANQGKAK